MRRKGRRGDGKVEGEGGEEQERMRFLRGKDSEGEKGKRHLD